jgi:hypothetical protein
MRVITWESNGLRKLALKEVMTQGDCDGIGDIGRLRHGRQAELVADRPLHL